MHNPAAHSAVSDALVKFAANPLTARGALSVAAAGRALAQARTNAAAVDDAGRQTAALLQAQGSGPNDMRVRAWVLGATLATQGGR